MCNQLFHSTWQGLLVAQTGAAQRLFHGFGYVAYGYTAVKQEVFNEPPLPPNATCLKTLHTRTLRSSQLPFARGKGIKSRQIVVLSPQIPLWCEGPPFPPLGDGDGNDLPYLISVYHTWLAPQATAARLR